MGKFLDKNGRQILPGMRIRIDGKYIEEVFELEGAFGGKTLGVSAMNPAYLKNHPDTETDYYNLSDFWPEQLEIVD